MWGTGPSQSLRGGLFSGPEVRRTPPDGLPQVLEWQGTRGGGGGQLDLPGELFIFFLKSKNFLPLLLL